MKYFCYNTEVSEKQVNVMKKKDVPKSWKKLGYIAGTIHREIVYQHKETEEIFLVEVASRKANDRPPADSWVVTPKECLIEFSRISLLTNCYRSETLW